MRPFFGKLMPGPEPRDPVFEDLSGQRVRRMQLWVKTVLAVSGIWLLALALFLIWPEPPSAIKSAFTEGLSLDSTRSTTQKDAVDLIDARAATDHSQKKTEITHNPASRPRCESADPMAGAALAGPNSVFPSRVFALLPSYPESAFLSLLRNCNRIDVILPEWHEISGPDLAVSIGDVDAEMSNALSSVKEVRGDSIEVWQVFSLSNSLSANAFLNSLQDEERRSRLVEEIVTSAKALMSEGVCINLRDVKVNADDALESFAELLSLKADEQRLQLCLIATLSDKQWEASNFSSYFDKIIVAAYQEPWIGSMPQPLSPLDWFVRQVEAIQENVPDDKLVVAVGGHAVDWVSGSAIPERISLADAMVRISEADASIEFSSVALNSSATFFDRSGNRHLLWMLDAPTVHNLIQALQTLGVTSVAIPSLGEEEPAYWAMLDGDMDPDAQAAMEAPVFPDNVSYSGEGSFYRFLSPAKPGRRLWSIEVESGLIVDIRYEVVPQPLQMERYGRGEPNQIALTFDDGPDATATSQILDALAAHDAPATFFVVGKAALSSPHLLKRAIDEGHIVGSHSFSHPYMDEIAPFLARTELSANRSLIEGVIGRSPLLYRPPYVRGPGPISESEAMVFSILQEDSYFAAGSDIVPPDWTGASAKEIVQQVVEDLETTGGNVIVLHDGRSAGMHTAEAVDLLIPELRSRGYEIVSLPTLLDMTTDAAMPVVESPVALFKGMSVSVITSCIALLSILFWLCVLSSLARSAVYLVLAARRDPVFPRSFAGYPSVSVVVPAYNEEKVIIATMRSILGSDYDNLTCVVVDDGSTDGTVQAVQKAFGSDPRVRLLRQENQGKWQALNHAFQTVTTEIAVCVDADTRIAPDAIRHIVTPFSDRKVAAVAGTVIVGNTAGLLTKFQSIEYVTAQQIARRAHEHLNGIMVVPGALGAWRVEAVRDVGLYSNETLTEDADLTIWLRRGGYRIAYAEDARSWTEVPGDVPSLLKQRLRWSLGNLQTLWKHRGAFIEIGPRRFATMLDMIFFGYLLPLLSPILDLMFLFILTTLFVGWYTGLTLDELAVSYFAVLAVALVLFFDIALAWIAHKRENMPKLNLLYLIPMMSLMYRPLLYITVYRALWSAASGRLAKWNKLQRLGSVQDKVLNR